MTKLRVQARHLQVGDIVGSGAKVVRLTVSSINWPSSKVQVCLHYPNKAVVEYDPDRIDSVAYWGKYTQINIDRT
jgi:hypothetical protein